MQDVSRYFMRLHVSHDALKSDTQSKPGYSILQKYNRSHLLPSSLSAGCV